MNKEVINLTIPGKSEYISVARLTISGIASKMGFDIGSIDDLKVSLAEACINALKLEEKNQINMEFEVKEDSILVKVAGVKEIKEDECNKYAELNLGILIIKSLMDEVIFSEEGIEMIKYIGVDTNDYD